MPARLSLKQARELGIPIPRREPGRAPVNEPLPNVQIIRVCESLGLPAPVPEFCFHAERRWRFDYAWPVRGQVALECQGGLFSGGRHVRGAALLQEYEKLNEAQLLGWLVLLVTPKQVESGEAFTLVKRALDARRDA